MRHILSVPHGTLVNRFRRSTEGTLLLFSRKPFTTFGYNSGKLSANSLGYKMDFPYQILAPP
jgi:hypothetical protein